MNDDWYRATARLLLGASGVWFVGYWVGWPGLAVFGKVMLAFFAIFGWGGLLVEIGGHIWRRLRS